MAEQPSRKLAVILHADVVGSTDLVQRDETLAHARIQDAFRRFSKTIKAYQGTTHELRGDALVAEFTRPSDAVAAALAFQIENAEFNARLEDDLQPQLRIGVSLGEVIVADNTVTGAGVVLAQRIEQLAESGRVCITAAIHEAVPQHFPLEYTDIGKREIRGFEEPVQVYGAGVKAGKQVPRPEPADSVEALPRKPKRLWIAGALALLVLVVGGLTWFQQWKQREEPASIERMAFSLPDKPSIAVLPFTNMSGDAEQEYFVDGMTEDLITDLSKLSGLFIIARNSTFTYKGKSVKVRQVAEELGVRYVLEGSVRRAGSQVRINAQLVDATTGGHLWAERYDGDMTDVFALQDKVTQKIAAALAVTMTVGEEARLAGVETKNLEAYDAFLEGWARYRQFTPEDFAKAILYFERAVQLDPNYGRAHAALASVYFESWVNSWLRRLNIGANASFELTKRHLTEAMKNPTPLAHRTAALLHAIGSYEHSAGGNFSEAIREAERGVELDPNDPSGHDAMAWVLILSGRPDESLQFIKAAQRLDPQNNYLFRLGQVQLQLKQYEIAAETFRRFTQRNATNYRAFVYLAAAYGHLGRIEEGKSAFQTLEDIFPRFAVVEGVPWRLELLQGRAYGKREAQVLHAGLRKLGIGSEPVEILDRSPKEITLKKGSLQTPIRELYETASRHCRAHGRRSSLTSSAPPEYVFGCF